MAKVPFSKLQAKVNANVTKLSYNNASGEEVLYEVKSYLPFEEKLELVSRIINKSMDDSGFYNPMRVNFNMVLEVVYTYTNLSFTEKMKEDAFKLYDILISTGIFTDIINAIDEKDWTEIQTSVWNTIKNIYDYQNSALGILNAIKMDYNLASLDLSAIQDKISDPDNLALLKEIAPLLESEFTLDQNQ
jgi:hypothetical protein